MTIPKVGLNDFRIAHDVGGLALDQHLAEVEYDGAAVIESFTPGTVEIAKAASIWRPLAPSQDALASDGARFLRELLG